MKKFDPIAEKSLYIRTAYDWEVNNAEAQAIARFRMGIMLISLAIIVLSTVVIYITMMPLVNQCVADYTLYSEVTQCVIQGNPALEIIQNIIRAVVLG